jgi:hypothetical protein
MNFHRIRSTLLFLLELVAEMLFFQTEVVAQEFFQSKKDN